MVVTRRFKKINHDAPSYGLHTNKQFKKRLNECHCPIANRANIDILKKLDVLLTVPLLQGGRINPLFKNAQMPIEAAP